MYCTLQWNDNQLLPDAYVGKFVCPKMDFRGVFWDVGKLLTRARTLGLFFGMLSRGCARYALPGCFSGLCQFGVLGHPLPVFFWDVGKLVYSSKHFRDFFHDVGKLLCPGTHHPCQFDDINDSASEMRVITTKNPECVGRNDRHILSKGL